MNNPLELWEVLFPAGVLLIRQLQAVHKLHYTINITYIINYKNSHLHFYKLIQCVDERGEREKEREGEREREGGRKRERGREREKGERGYSPNQCP